MPKKVDQLVRQIARANPSYSEAQAWATAWSVYCKHAKPGSQHCRRPRSGYLRGSSAGFVAPPSVARAAKEGLALRSMLPMSRQCCTPSGLLTAKLLSERKPMPLERVRKMAAYFDRHEVDKSGRGWGRDSKGWQAWLLWGGDAGRRWARSIAARR